MFVLLFYETFIHILYFNDDGTQIIFKYKGNNRTKTKKTKLNWNSIKIK